MNEMETEHVKSVFFFLFFLFFFSQGDGMVDFFEFAQMIASKIKMGEPEKELRKTFNVFDKNGDGVISSEELKTVFESIGEHLTEFQINTMMAEADENHDGKLDFTGTLSIVFKFFI